MNQGLDCLRAHATYPHFTYVMLIKSPRMAASASKIALGHRVEAGKGENAVRLLDIVADGLDTVPNGPHTAEPNGCEKIEMAGGPACPQS